MREMARSIVGAEHFIEVYVKAQKEVCAQRDPKGLYRSHTAGLSGVSSPYEEPESPDIIIDTEILSVDDCVERVVEELNRKCIFNISPQKVELYEEGGLQDTPAMSNAEFEPVL
jgi:adenylylsulfate kinase-like enzyme